MRISDWSSDVCSSDLNGRPQLRDRRGGLSHRLDRYPVVHRHQRLRPQRQWRQGEERWFRIYRDAKAYARPGRLAQRRLYPCAPDDRYRPQCRRVGGGPPAVRAVVQLVRQCRLTLDTEPKSTVTETRGSIPREHTRCALVTGVLRVLFRSQLFTVMNGFGLNANGGKAKSDGFEFTATLKPTRGLVASLNGAYTHARLTTDTDPNVGGLAGDRLPFVPKFNWNANVDYSWNLGTETKAFVGASLRSLSKQRANFDAGFGALYGLGRRTIPAYEVIDLRARSEEHTS